MSDEQPPGLLGRVRAAASGRLGTSAGGFAAPRRGAPLVAAGVFDREFYEAQAGRTFESDLDAAEHCVTVGAARLSPHPLLDFSYLTIWNRERFRTARSAAVILDYLRAKGQDRALSVLFDPTLVEGRHAARHPAGALGHFLATATPHSELPGRPGVTLAQVRPILIEAAARLGEQSRRRDLSRTTTEWDSAAESAWRRRWADAPLPESAGPLVSVVMPVRNRSPVITAAIESVQAQTLDAWELLVVDDGSSDDTREVVSALAAADPRIRLLVQDWAGVCAARNTGLAAATGRYVAFLDSDNEWRPEFLRLAVGATHGQGLRAAYAGLAFVDDDGVHRYRAFRGTLDDLLVVNHVDLNVLVVETELAREVGGFDPSLRRWVDHDFAIRLAQRTELSLLPFLGVDYEHSMDLSDRITTTESDSWQFVVLEKHWVRWDEVRATAAERVPGRVSIVIPTWNDARMTNRAVDTVLRTTEGLDVEVIVVDNGSRLDAAIGLVAGNVGRERVRLERLPRNLNFSAGCNVGLARSTGEFVVFLNNDTEPRPGWLSPLLAALEDKRVLGAQPLLQYPDDTVQTAGTVFPVVGYIPIHFLVGHPPEDVLRLRDRDFSAVTAAALAMRARDVVDLNGFDPLFVNGMEDVDLCLRASQMRPGTFRLVAESRVTHFESKTEGRNDQIPLNRDTFIKRWAGRLPASDAHRWADLGFEIAHLRSGTMSVPAPRPTVIRRPTGLTDAGTPLRWALHLPSIGGEIGDYWGDTHFGASLARSLESLGHQVVTHRHGAHDGFATAYDDVVLGLRGLDVMYPTPGKVSVLWVISHPEDVTPDEIALFDLVFAASEPWAREMTARSGREVRPLLQATDTSARTALTGPVGDGSRPVFVGGAPRGRVRPVVQAAVSHGVPVVIHGPHWDRLIPPAHVGSSYVPNHELKQVYRNAGLVLSDHWQDMADAGFVANRIFDAVAAGARVVSDPVDGLEIFEGAVQTFADAEELAFLCSPEGRSSFPDDETMSKIAAKIAAEHSFDRRAAELSDALRQLLSGRGLADTP